jgi:hypothetical protein
MPKATSIPRNVPVQLVGCSHPEFIDAHGCLAELDATHGAKVKPLTHLAGLRPDLHQLNGATWEAKLGCAWICVYLGFEHLEGRHDAKPADLLRFRPIRIRTPELAVPETLLEEMCPPLPGLANVVDYEPLVVSKIRRVE